MLLRRRKNIKDLSDEELALNYRTSQESMYVGELYERYTHIVYLVCMKYVKNEGESEDLSMQVFEKLMVDLAKYEVRSFKYWLHTVTKNHCLAYLEKKKKHRRTTEELKEEISTSEELIPQAYQDVLDRELTLERLENAITYLKDAQRVCIELFYLQKKSYQEVAEMTGYSLKQVKSYIQNGKRNLKIHLTNSSVDNPS
ncbi:MAG: sigma-70 family RNA polymerase sigma factor [Bacteroidia bacterium]|nr:sigma-70 family RNA polymerase sigma factor [Bacteroidia bacterium]